MRVVVAEDSYLIREALTAVLSAHGDVTLLTTAATLQESLAAVDASSPDVLITDVRMPPGLDDEGVQAAEILARTHPQIGVVVLSQYVEPEWARRIFDAKAAGRAYLLKEHLGDLDELRRCLDTVVAGGTVMDPSVAEALVRSQRQLDASPLSQLTEREAEVLELVASGLSNAAIADRLYLSVRAVEKNVSSVLDKLDLPADDNRIHRRVRAAVFYVSSLAK